MAKQRGSIYPIVFLTLVVFLSVVSLTLMDQMTREKILAAQQAEIQEMLSTLFPSLETFTYDEGSGQYTILKNSAAIGKARMLQAGGYGGAIDILVGIEPDGKLRGIRIISQQETPGLGAKISEPAFLDKFVGVAVNELDLSRDGGSIDAITGATISSRAVVDALKETLQNLVEEGGDE
ncbi:RnfABCDGE type electron transport complex subunit G [Candidatus Bipolaricaulota bacterium]|nr:RnfABCDGE type electron transport complex subunit G [Candidatus Bipolaricaulota bacterium]